MKKKKKKTKYYVHPIDALDPNLSEGKKLDKKIDSWVWGVWAIFIIIVCLLIPGFEILSEILSGMIRCGSIWLRC